MLSLMRGFRRPALALLALAAMATAAGDVAAKKQTFGEGAPFAAYQGPGYPEGIVVDGDQVFVSGPATFDQTGASVGIYHRVTGAFQGTIPIQEATPGAADSLSCITTDGEGRLYVLSEGLGVLRLTRHGNQWSQEVYAPIPDDGLPGCLHGFQLAPGPDGQPQCHLLNDLAFDREGFLYVTDSFRSTIYRVDPGGGALEPWFQSGILAGAQPFPIGANGIRVGPDGESIYFSVSTAALPSVQGQGRIYRLPRVDVPEEDDLQVVHAYAPGVGPDGIAFGEDGVLYAALAFTSQISMIDVDACGGPSPEIGRLSGPAGSSIPYDSPANVAFDGKGSLLATNHASLSNIAADFTVLRVFVGDEGAPLVRPRIH